MCDKDFSPKWRFSNVIWVRFPLFIQEEKDLESDMNPGTCISYFQPLLNCPFKEPYQIESHSCREN